MIKPLRLRAAVIGLAAATLAAGAVTAASAQAIPPADCAGPASNTWLNIAVEGVRSSNGLVAVTLYADNKSKFLAKHGSLYTGRFPARAGTTQACIFVPKPGTYAIATYHDENASRKLDRSGLGLPREGFGFSNNPSTLFGIPSFSSVRLSVAPRQSRHPDHAALPLSPAPPRFGAAMAP